MPVAEPATLDEENATDETKIDRHKKSGPRTFIHDLLHYGIDQLELRFS